VENKWTYSNETQKDNSMDADRQTQTDRQTTEYTSRVSKNNSTTRSCVVQSAVALLRVELCQLAKENNGLHM